jgi:hypothetical protein
MRFDDRLTIEKLRGLSTKMRKYDAKANWQAFSLSFKNSCGYTFSIVEKFDIQKVIFFQKIQLGSLKTEHLKKIFFEMTSSLTILKFQIFHISWHSRERVTCVKKIHFVPTTSSLSVLLVSVLKSSSSRDNFTNFNFEVRVISSQVMAL